MAEMVDRKRGTVKVAITDLQSCVKLDTLLLRGAIRHVARSEGEKRDISAVYVNDERIAELNEQFLSHRGPTDVIAFELDAPGDPDGLLGEVVVSTETALRQARRRRIAILRELLLYTIHGVLHLLGYDDTTSQQARRMRRRQRQLLDEILEERR